MSTFELTNIDRDLEDDLRAEARHSMFAALRKAFKHRSEQNGVLAKDLAEALGKDRGYVSRVLNGTNRAIDFETLFVFLEGLKYYLPLEPIPYEELECKKPNYDARPTASVSISSGKVTIPLPNAQRSAGSVQTESNPVSLTAKQKGILVSTVSL